MDNLVGRNIIAYRTRTWQWVNLVLDTILQALRIEKKKVATELQLHGDQGLQHISLAYFNLTKLRHYVFDVKTWRSMRQGDDGKILFQTRELLPPQAETLLCGQRVIDRYIRVYKHEHIQTKTGATPLLLRRSRRN